LFTKNRGKHGAQIFVFSRVVNVLQEWKAGSVVASKPESES
jgi:hypothetical protein